MSVEERLAEMERRYDRLTLDLARVVAERDRLAARLEQVRLVLDAYPPTEVPEHWEAVFGRIAAVVFR